MPLVDLDDPEELRARWTALAAVAHATGFDRRWYADADGYHHQDETASVLRLARIGDGRVVLWGFHTQHSATAGADLLAGSPDWIGQPEVRQRQASGELGFVYGAFNGTWARASYPGDPWQPADDGFQHIGGWITSDEAAADEMVEWVAEWADYLDGLDELRQYGVELIRTTLRSGVTGEALAAFFSHFRIDPRSPVQPEIAAGLVAAEDFTRNFAVPASFPDDPDTAEVSVVEDVVIGSPDSRPSSSAPEDEESYVVPPGISPFTGQPIDDPPYNPPYEPYDASAAPVAHEARGREGAAGPAAYETEAGVAAAHEAGGHGDYGVTGKKQGWLRRRKHDTGSTPAVEPEPHEPAPGPGAYLPQDAQGGSLPTPTYDPTLPSAEPPRVGGGQYEGDDFYNSLFADAPAAAAPTADEQDWETAEQPSWSNQDPTSEYNPFADDTAENNPAWTGPAWINGQWVENPPTHRTSPQATPDQPGAHPSQPGAHPSQPGGQPSQPGGQPVAHPTPGQPTPDQSGLHPEQHPGADPGSPAHPERPAHPGADLGGAAYAEHPGAPTGLSHPGAPAAPATLVSSAQPPTPTSTPAEHHAPAPTRAGPPTPSSRPTSAARPSPVTPGRPGDLTPPGATAHFGAPAQPLQLSQPAATGQPTAQKPTAPPAAANSPFAPAADQDTAPPDSPFAPTPAANGPSSPDLEDDDAPTAEIAAVLDPPPRPRKRTKKTSPPSQARHPSPQ